MRTPRSPPSRGSRPARARRHQTHHVERADEVDLDDLGEGIEGGRSLAPDDFRGGADAGAVDEDAGDAVLRRGGAIAASALAPSATSQGRARPPISRAVASAASAFRSSRATLAPAAASARAVAAPGPRRHR